MNLIVFLEFWQGRRTPSPDLLELLKKRTEARAQKNWALSDQYRDEISKKGYVMKILLMAPFKEGIR